MLPLKKTTAKAEHAQALAWHPNFRNSSLLPDTKTVRTKFFVNILFISFTCAALLYVVLWELDLRSLNTELKGIELQITDNTKQSESAVAIYKLFQTEEKLFNEAYILVKDPFRLTDFVISLGDILPPAVKIKRIDYRGLLTGVVVAGSVDGLDADASEVVSSLVLTMQADKILSKDFPIITLTGLGRSVGDKAMDFELSFAPKTPPKVPVKGEVKK